MQTTEFNLETLEGGQVATKIINPSLNVTFNDGIMQINGTLAVKTASDRVINMPVPFEQYSVRLAELENQNTAPLNEADAAKLQAKKDIFNTLLAAVKSATETAAQAIYLLNNPDAA